MMHRKSKNKMLMAKKALDTGRLTQTGAALWLSVISNQYCLKAKWKFYPLVMPSSRRRRRRRPVAISARFSKHRY